MSARDPLEVFGQGEEFAARLAAARAGRLPHGLVVAGPRRAGKSLAALALARALLCGDAPADDPAARRVARGVHGDLHLLGVPPDRVDIPVEAVRALLETLERRPVEGGARVAVIDPADRLNEQGQNALLKTLEEPGPATWLLLVTSRPEALLETVRSRAQTLRIRALTDAEVRSRLDPPPTASAKRIASAVRAARGELGTARLLLDDAVRPVDDLVRTFFADPPATCASIGRQVLDGAEGRTETEQRVRLVLWLLGVRLREIVAGELAAAGDAFYVQPHSERWLTALETVLAAEGDLAAGIPALQVVDGLFLQLAWPDTVAGA